MLNDVDVLLEILDDIESLVDGVDVADADEVSELERENDSEGDWVVVALVLLVTEGLKDTDVELDTDAVGLNVPLTLVETELLVVVVHEDDNDVLSDIDVVALALKDTVFVSDGDSLAVDVLLPESVKDDDTLALLEKEDVEDEVWESEVESVKEAERLIEGVVDTVVE